MLLSALRLSSVSRLHLDLETPLITAFLLAIIPAATTVQPPFPHSWAKNISSAFIASYISCDRVLPVVVVSIVNFDITVNFLLSTVLPVPLRSLA